MNRRPPDPNSVPTIAEQRRLLAVNRAAVMFYRRQLLKASTEWAKRYLMRGAPEVLDPNSNWSIGFAPDARSQLTDSLRVKGFDLASVRNAGLALLDPEGRTIDRFRDQLMLPTRNNQLETVGFIGVRADPSPFYATSPSTQVHRRSNALVGIAEQLDLLTEGAVPVVVNSPLDPLAIERVSRLTTGRWSGIPLCDTLLSAQQARILARYAATDSVIVAARDSESAAVGLLDDLARFFPRVWAVELPPLTSVNTVAADPAGQQFLHDTLLMARPLADYRRRRPRRRSTTQEAAPEHPDRGPALD